MPEKLFTPKEVCELLQISRTTLDKWIKLKKLPTPFRIGGKKLLFSAESLKNFLNPDQAVEGISSHDPKH